MKEEAKEIVQAVSETIKERASNPIIVTFIISWCVYNWNALLLLAFSKEAIAKRIDIASLQFIETKSWLFPIIFTVGYCLLSKPLNAGLRKLMEKIDHFVISLEYSREMTKQKHEEQLEVLKAKKEMAYDSTKTDEKSKIQKMNEEITKSKDREGVLTQEVTVLKSENESLKGKITNFEITQKQLKNQVDNTTTENSTLSQSKTMLEENEERLKVEINSLKNVISDFEKQASELIKANDTLKSKNNDLAKTIETYKNQLNPLMSPKLEQYPIFNGARLNAEQLASDALKRASIAYQPVVGSEQYQRALKNINPFLQSDTLKRASSFAYPFLQSDTLKRASSFTNPTLHSDTLKHPLSGNYKPQISATSNSDDISNKLPPTSDDGTKGTVDKNKKSD
ncbi:hypothetical protein OKT76_09080 [Providencia rettgeri]|uniref:hypothetical protein n=1 Tax=Providencia rettgeri TaxID=587 RepID=UPI0018C6F8C3|nr:hypothetical protein [Providencia rettgeri]MBG5921544.1 hypothetical protein [Providencia rettgeri]MCX9095880.1 hypothetical protein [Providencia rettgeri]HEM8211678.1 hypothetical protein [Providencia rettgeri]